MVMMMMMMMTMMDEQWRRSVVKYGGQGQSVQAIHQTVSDYTSRQ